MLITDTNILQRCSLGRAMIRVRALVARGVDLATTDRNIDELARNLASLEGIDETLAWQECQRVVAPFRIVLAEEYEHRRADADARLREGGKSDWPALAAALALDAELWSDDVDFFGVGVPVWTTPNVRFVEPATN